MYLIHVTRTYGLVLSNMHRFYDVKLVMDILGFVRPHTTQLARVIIIKDRYSKQTLLF